MVGAKTNETLTHGMAHVFKYKTISIAELFCTMRVPAVIDYVSLTSEQGSGARGCQPNGPRGPVALLRTPRTPSRPSITH